MKNKKINYDLYVGDMLGKLYENETKNSYIWNSN